MNVTGYTWSDAHDLLPSIVIAAESGSVSNSRSVRARARSVSPGGSFRLISLYDAGLPLRDVLEGIALLQNSSVRVQMESLSVELRQALDCDFGCELPAMLLTESEDGSATIHWNFQLKRLAFTVEPNAEQSGWHVVSSSDSGMVLEGGFVAELKILPMIRRFLKM
jgi:hypothetical protein